MKTFVKWSLCTFFAILTAFCTLLSAFAAEEAPSTDNTFVPVEESSISRQEALEILGYTEEDLNGGQILVGDFEISSRNSIEPANPFDSGYFSFSGRNVGSYRTLYGNVLGYAILWKPTEDLSSGVPALEVNFYAYGNSKALKHHLMYFYEDTPNYGDYYRLPTQTLEIQDGLDYHFIYDSYHAYYDGYWGKDSKCSVRVIMATSY